MGTERELWLNAVKNPHSPTLEHHLTVLTCLVLFGVASISVGINLALGMPLTVLWISLLAAIAFGGFYLLVRFTVPQYWHRLMLSYLGLGALVLNWFPNNGILGATPLLYSVLLVLAQAILNRRDFWLFLGACLLSLSLLFGMDLYYPEWNTPYGSVQAHKWDLYLTLLLVFSIAGGVFFCFRLLYEEEQRALERMTLYKSQFLAHMSHELRTPMNAVLGFSRVLQTQNTENLSALQQTYLQRIQDNGKHLLTLIDELLDISSIESGKLRLDFKKVCMRRFLADMVESVRPLAESKGLKLEVEIESADTEISLETDPVRLRQIVLNLVANGLKYTAEGKVILRLCVYPRHLEVQIEDTGPGLSEAQQQKIFEAYYRLDQASVGTGLGLSISAQLCQMLGYHLRVESQTTGKTGSIFTLNIPRTDTSA